MKAIINGVTVEGTPDEIIAYKRLDARQTEMDAYKKIMNGYGYGSTGYPSWMDTIIVCNIMQDDE